MHTPEYDDSLQSLIFPELAGGAENAARSLDPRKMYAKWRLTFVGHELGYVFSLPLLVMGGRQLINKRQGGCLSRT